MYVISIRRYTHFFTVKNLTPDLIGLVLKFSLRYVHREFRQVGGKTITQPTKVYGSRATNNEFRFHIGQYKDFIKYLTNHGIYEGQIDSSEEPMYEPTRMESSVQSKFEEREYQTDIKEFLCHSEIDDNHSRLVSLQTGAGKGVVVDTLIKVPRGWKEVGKLKIGEDVIAADGSVSQVTGIYPQGIEPTYKIMFSDGRSTICDSVHLWKVHNKKWEVDGSDGYRVLTTKELFPYLVYDKLSIPLISPEDSEPLYTESDTYLYDLGKRMVQDTIHKDLYTPFKHGSLHQRLELIRGMLDINGYRVCSDTIHFITDNIDVEQMLTYLLRSIGGISRTSITHKHNFNKHPGLIYHISAQYKDIEELFKRNIDHQISYSEDYVSIEPKLYIKSIEPAGNTECVCISIAHPDKLYVCKDFVVTHNTFISLSASSKLGYRTLIFILPKYIEKWAGDVVNVLDVSPEDVLAIRGGKDLRTMLHLAEDNNLDAKFIIISITTLQTYYDDYVKYGSDIVDYGYPYPPEDMCRKLGIGTVIIDEAHQQLYSVFRVLLHVHVPKVIALSATLISDDQFITNMQSLMFPKEIRYDKVPIKKYTKVVAYSYGFINFSMANKIRISNRGSTNYSHIQFENSIIKNKQLLHNYLNLICYIVDIEYKQKYITGDKYLVYAASIDMCTRITEILKVKYPDRDVRRYVEDDPYENVIDADIRVSTVLSAGTAVDIPNLRGALLTTSIQSPVSNLQSMGRLRELKDRDVTFSYLYNYHIPKQVNYHKAKKELLYDRVLSIKEFRIPEGI